MFKYSLSWPENSPKHYFNHSIHPTQRAALRAGKTDRDQRLEKDDKAGAATIHVWMISMTVEPDGE